MALKWPTKDPDSKGSYSIDWSRFLDTDTIGTVTWYIDDSDGTKTEVSNLQTVNGLTFVGGSRTNTVATAVFEAGTVNTVYDITCKITYSTDPVLEEERTIKLPVRER